MSEFKVSVVTHERKVLEKEAEYLRLRTSDGDVGILANHAPLVSELIAGKMEIKVKGNVDTYFLSGGFLEISNNEATVIADEIIPKEDIRLNKEKERLERLESVLHKTSNEDEIKLIHRRINHCKIKIDIVS